MYVVQCFLLQCAMTFHIHFVTIPNRCPLCCVLFVFSISYFCSIGTKIIVCSYLFVFQLDAHGMHPMRFFERMRLIWWCHVLSWCVWYGLHLSRNLKSTSVSVCFQRIRWLPSAFVFLRWLKLAHIFIQVCTFHDGCKQGIDQQIFNRKSISRKITHPQSLFK